MLTPHLKSTCPPSLVRRAGFGVSTNGQSINTQKHAMKYIFINYKNEVIHTEETDNPEETESFLVAIGFEVGGFQLAK